MLLLDQFRRLWQKPRMSDLRKIGKYEVIEVLSEDRERITYKAFDPDAGRPVAICMIIGRAANSRDSHKRFEREAQLSGKLQHPNIVSFHELGVEAGRAYSVTEYLDGEPLENVISTGKSLSVTEKIRIMIQILEGLQHAHENGFIHRDIKAGNVLILKDGTAKLTHFEIAKIDGQANFKTGKIIGTINYMAPEQFNGQLIDKRADIFCAGALFYELLTGKLPFDAPSTPAVILKILNEHPPALAQYLTNVPEGLEAIVKRSLAKDRERRYPSAGSMSADLGRLLAALGD